MGLAIGLASGLLHKHADHADPEFSPFRFGPRRIRFQILQPFGQERKWGMRSAALFQAILNGRLDFRLLLLFHTEHFRKPPMENPYDKLARFADEDRQ